MDEWITEKEAAAILGVHKSTIPKMIRRGALTRREQRPVLNLAQVLAYRDIRQRPPEPKPVKEFPAPPDHDHDWLSADDASELIGISRIAVMARARRQRIPSTVSDNRRWFRKDHLALYMQAQRARASRTP